MRRSYSDRIFLFLSVLLIFYIGWFIINSFSRISRDPEEEMAYLHAISGSLPIVHNVHLCTSNEIDLIIIIISSGSNFLERQAIRETWGSISHIMNVHSQRLFVVGYHSSNNLYKDLSNEAHNEQDLLYLTIDDDLMTLKELHAYRWLDKYCPNVTFTFKTDDDLFVNSFLLHELIQELKTNPDKFQNRYLYNHSLDSLFLAHLNPDAHTFLFGWAFEPGKPERNASVNPYYVSYKEYPKELYPHYCSSFGYLMDSKTRNLLVEEGFNDRYPFRFSDIFITGILPERLNFICDSLPFTYHQGTTQDCIDIIKLHNKKTLKLSTPPLIVCSTGRHVAQNTFSDYYRIWSVLKFFFSNQISSTRSRKSKD
ncbi:unnamed protein product [Rotaria sp. Silwood1]|nr:unnamed protein product [Rotaria sp. Silwood1]CAF1498437.1 unnamed protein product [Rotaria sp. Silwood1]CAF3652519.1 unnamed protein product [Rotaria sp. Silwood1]CAF3695978.1 unnamed protein product [Rotaria sp. Silwood1]CAF4728366.1 unnamed protein product [Rotaria sp. Silwood1]